MRSEAGYLEKQIEICVSEHAQLTEQVPFLPPAQYRPSLMFAPQFNLFKLSLEKAEVELKDADAAKKSVLDEQVVFARRWPARCRLKRITPPRQVKVDKNVVRMAQEVQKLEDDISAALNDQTTLQKSQVTHCAGKCSGCTLRSHTPARRT